MFAIMAPLKQWASVVIFIVLYVQSLGNESHLESPTLMTKLMHLLNNKPSPHLSLECVAQHCLAPSLACLDNTNCRESINCAKNCLQAWDNDTTKQKLHVQNCTNICAFSFADDVYEKLMTCFTDYECISFPPIPRMCLANDGIVPFKQLTIKDLAAEQWWVVKGLNQVYDCYPCQTVQFNQINSKLWDYMPQYEVYLHNGSLELVTQHLPIASQPPNSKNISFVYHDVGLKHSETWWLLNEADDKSWIAMYYCGNTLQWYYEGALVFARNQTLSDNYYQSISDTYKSILGVDFSQFCNVRNSDNCPNIV